jgi:isochorismate synthase
MNTLPPPSWPAADPLGATFHDLDLAERWLAQLPDVERSEWRLVVAWDQPGGIPERVVDGAPVGSWAVAFAAPDGDRYAGAYASALVYADGPARFAHVARATADVFRRIALVDLRRDAAQRVSPVRFVGGFAFDEEAPPRALWGSFGSASFVLPARIEGADAHGPWRAAVLPAASHRAEAFVVQAVALTSEQWGSAEIEGLYEATPSSLRDAPSVERAAWQERGLDAERYVDAVRAALRSIDRDELQKVVLARSRTFGLEERPTPSLLMERLRAANPLAWTFHFGAARGVAFVGATPEQLVRAQGASLHALALAGTVAAPAPLSHENRRALEAQLLASDKDRREHAYVVDAIASTLRAWCEDVELPSAPSAVLSPGVLHLATPLHAQLREGVAALQVVERLHPTPAVGGAPRDHALARIRAIEGGVRGWYAAPVGWIAPGAIEFVVALRSALLYEGAATVLAGAGIVRGSEPHAELRETEAKMLAMKQALGVLPSPPTPRSDS